MAAGSIKFNYRLQTMRNCIQFHNFRDNLYRVANEMRYIIFPFITTSFKAKRDLEYLQHLRSCILHIR